MSSFIPASVLYFTGPHARFNAQQYVAKRMIDALTLRREMAFRLISDDTMRCEIYGHAIHLLVRDTDIPAGCGRLYINGADKSLPFTHIDQAVAWILATNW